ncbi:hypothetical protein E2C01_050493 [Portunus trituberculatus]|uniref:Uncharacterized protein n=1 Tax=Portunus trituberculatus TaxID=210409 RepID=A0A5B7G952_PORTR|nr:hypothetical protein [Portunus trituberculatus]
MKTVIFLLREKKVKTPVVILIVIWEKETNPHSDIHKPPHILPSSNALVCVTHGCLYRTVLVGQVIVTKFPQYTGETHNTLDTLTFPVAGYTTAFAGAAAPSLKMLTQGVGHRNQPRGCDTPRPQLPPALPLLSGEHLAALILAYSLADRREYYAMHGEW